MTPEDAEPYFSKRKIMAEFVRLMEYTRQLEAKLKELEARLPPEEPPHEVL